MEIPISVQPTAKYSVWDQDVPIIVNKNITHVYISDNISDPYLYNEFCHKLRAATVLDTFYVYLNTPGGLIDSAFMIIDAIEQSDALVIAKLSGTVASAGTLIALACDQIEVANHTAFMIHNYSGGMSGKGHEMKARQEFADKSLNNTFKCFYKGFLTDNEMQDVIDGKDLWMGKDEVIERWGNKQALLLTNTCE